MKQQILDIKDLVKSYGKLNVLNGVSFKIYEGEIVGLVGVNGSGKSTLIEILCGVKKRDKGSINGIVNKCTNLGYMPQSFSLFNDLTVKENIKYLALVYGLNGDVVEQTLQKCHLKNKENYLCSKLSGGYKQLVSLAGAIIHNPKLLLLDEPTSAMDPLFRDDFWNIINDYLKGGGTVLVTTHYLEEIEKCSRLMVLAKGKIIIDKKVETLLEENKNLSIAKLIYENAVEGLNED